MTLLDRLVEAGRPKDRLLQRIGVIVAQPPAISKKMCVGDDWKLAKECVDVDVSYVLELVGCIVINAAAVLSRSERQLFLSSRVLFQSG